MRNGPFAFLPIDELRDGEQILRIVNTPAELWGERLEGIEPVPPEHDLYRRGVHWVCLYVLDL